MLLCKRGSQQAVCHCNLHTVPQHICSGQNAIPTVLSAKEAHSRQCVTAVTPALHTGVSDITNALQHCSGQNAIPTVQCCSAKEAHSRQCVTAVTPMEICSSYRCPVTHHTCSATLFRAKCNPHCSVLLCKRGSQQAVCHCKTAVLLWLTAGSVSLQLHLWRFALHTGVQ